VSDNIPVLTVIAGTNGAGKSSIIGQYMRQRGGDYFNPDNWARVLRTSNPSLTQTRANSLAWQAGRDLLKSAIEQNRDHVLETTLDGNTIPLLIRQAAGRGPSVVIWYVGLDSPETHLHGCVHECNAVATTFPKPTFVNATMPVLRTFSHYFRK
jgi:predicted ABC-type ATPase